MKLLKQKDFTLLMLGKLVSLLGSNMQQFALSLYVLALTGSTTIFAAMLSVSILPRLLLSPIAGVFGDWFNRKNTIVILDLLNSIIIGVYAVIFIVNGSLTLPMIYVLVILLEITEIFFHSAMSAVLPSIVGKDDMMAANSLNSLIMNIGQLLTPVLAALIYGGFGLKVILIVTSICFFLSGISEMFINIPKTHKSPEKINLKAFKTDLMEGINVIKTNKFISSIISLGTIINFCIGPLFSIGLIYIIKNVLVGTDFQFGLFQMFLASSMIAAPLLCSGFIKKIKIGKLCFTSFSFIAVLILLMAIVPSSFLLNTFDTNLIPYIILLIISFTVGVFVTIVNIAVGTLFNQIVPLELMGRTSTVFNLAVTISIPIGQMLFGYLYDIIEPSYVILICGSILVLSLLRYKSILFKVDLIEDHVEDTVVEDIIVEDIIIENPVVAVDIVDSVTADTEIA